MTTRTYPEPVNYQEESGVWTPIDLTLRRHSDGTVHPTDAADDVAIPTSLSQPILMTHDDRQLAFRLLAADKDSSGDRATSGTGATFDDAIPDVDVKYTARGSGVKETVVLQSASARRVYSYSLTSDDDLSARIDDEGNLVMADRAGATQFLVTAPLAWDSSPTRSYSNALNLSVVEDGPGRWTLTMRPDSAWLDDPARVYPVSLDPYFTATLSTAEDCYLANGSLVNTSTCGAELLGLGYSASRAYRPDLRFNLGSALPPNAAVTSATLSMYLSLGSPHANVATRVHALTSSWDGTSTWNKRTATTAWTLPGGDVSANASFTGPSNPQIGSATVGWYQWTVPNAVVTGWANGTLANNGVQVSADAENSSTGVYYFNSADNSDPTTWPTLDISWTASDVTPPPAPAGLALNDADELEKTATISFAAPDDIGPPGAPISGVANSQVRFSVNGGTVGAWTTFTGAEFALPGVSVGDQLHVEVRDVDAAGNLSVSTAADVVVFSDSASIVDSDEAQAYSDQTGVNVVTATTWLGAQSATDDLVDQLANSSSTSSFAGSWFGADQTIHIQLTDASQSGYVDRFADAAGLLSYIVIDNVTYSEAGLVAENARVEPPLNDLVSANKLWLDVDPITQTIRWKLDSSVSAADRARVVQAAGTTIPAATVTDVPPGALVPDTASQVASRGDCTLNPDESYNKFFSNDPAPAYLWCSKDLRGGIQISAPAKVAAGSPAATAICTAGFNALDPATGAPGVMTAGHCLAGTLSTSNWTQVGKGTLGPNSTGANSTNGSRYVLDGAPNQASEFNDAGLIKYAAPPSTVQPQVVSRGNKDASLNETRSLSRAALRFRINRVTPQVQVGRFVCIQGAVTGRDCGRVIHRAGASAVWVNTCATRHGDSGGPVVAGHAAVGMLKGLAFESAPGGALKDAEAYAAPYGGLANHCSPKAGGGWNADLGYAIVQDIGRAESLVGARVLTYPWRKKYKDPATGSDVTVRATAGWNTSANIDLHAWDGSSTDPTIGHASPAGGSNIANGAASIVRDKTAYGPETFVDRSNGTADYAFGVCYKANPANGRDRKTKVLVTILQPNGAAVTKTVTLSGVGDGAIVRFDGTNVRSTTLTASNTATWCAPATQLSIDRPVATVAPSLTHQCADYPSTGCAYVPGVWTGSPTLSYASKLCTSAASCGTLDSTPGPTAVIEATGGGCFRQYYVITTVATNEAGQTFVPDFSGAHGYCVV